MRAKLVVVSLVTAGIGLLLAAPALADTTVGGTSPSSFVCSGIALSDSGDVIPSAGTITSWSTDQGGSGSGTLQFLVVRAGTVVTADMRTVTSRLNTFISAIPTREPRSMTMAFTPDVYEYFTKP